MTHPKTAKLARWQVRTLVLSGAVLWLSDAGWLGLHYFGRHEGEFGPEASPFEPWLLKLHGAAVVVALLGLGSLSVAHVARGWAYRSQRVSGSMLTATTVVLVVTGYLLYYVGDEAVRDWVGIAHWVIGLGALAAFTLHYRQGRRIGRR